ncbi:hypothetical protein [Luteibacter sp. CQ10]|uniref:hypothetical protein n=1 Tax=Luteibacter sp. CQ10 TaxID=2805821 RepID=UPI0034A5B770
MDVIAHRKPSFPSSRLATACLLACLASLPGRGNAQIYNADPSPDNPVNTHITRTLRSTDFNCNALVKSIWANDETTSSVAFSDNEIWYRVDSPNVRSLLFMAHAIGKKVCYQTEGGALDPIKISSAFIDPR